MFVGAVYMRCGVCRDCALNFSIQPAVYVKTELTGGHNKMDGLEQILMSKDVEVVTLKDVAIGKWDRDQVKLNATNMHFYHLHPYYYYHYYYHLLPYYYYHYHVHL
jgi:hypothetical protein